MNGFLGGIVLVDCMPLMLPNVSLGGFLCLPARDGVASLLAMSGDRWQMIGAGSDPLWLNRTGLHPVTLCCRVASPGMFSRRWLQAPMPMWSLSVPCVIDR